MVVGNPNGGCSSSTFTKPKTPSKPKTTSDYFGSMYTSPGSSSGTSSQSSNVNNNQGIATIKPTSTPEMQTGFGSFFGASSGSTGSSPLVQETLKKVYDKAIEDRKEQAQEDKELYTADMHNQAIMDAFENVYPTTYIRDIPSMGIKAGDPFKTLSQEEYLKMAGIDPSLPQELLDEDPLYKDALLDFNISNMFDLNLMDIPEGHRGIEEDFYVQPQFGGGGGGSYSGGDGGDYGSYLGAGLGRRPKQLGDEESVPKGLRLLQYMVNLHKENPYTKMALRKKSGGIVSLVGG